MDTFTVAQRRDPESDFTLTGRIDAWNMWYATCGKQFQGKSHIKVNGQKIENPNYVTDDGGEMIVRFGNFLREVCYQEAPVFPIGDQCVAICQASCAWQAPQLRLQVLFLGGQRE